MHAFVLPVVEKDGVRRLNGKEFVKRADYTKLNNSIQAMTEDKYPGYTFMTGVKHLGKYQTVEDLKARSEKEQIKQEIEAEKLNALQVIHSEADKLDARERQLIERERAASDKESQNKEKENYWNSYEIKVKDIEESVDVSENAFANWKYVRKDGKTVDFRRWYEMFVKEQTKAANAKKQSLSGYSPAPKPVNYAQKAMEEVGRQVGSMIEKSARESIERKKLSIPPSWHEGESDEYSF